MGLYGGGTVLVFKNRIFHSRSAVEIRDVAGVEALPCVRSNTMSLGRPSLSVLILGFLLCPCFFSVRGYFKSSRNTEGEVVLTATHPNLTLTLILKVLPC
jgi:hypothetical protein